MSLINPDEYFLKYAKYDQIKTKYRSYIKSKSFNDIFDLFDEELKNTGNVDMAYEYVKCKLLSKNKSKYSQYTSSSYDSSSS